MAQGCINQFPESDIRNMDKRDVSDENKKKLIESANKSLSKKNKNELANILSNPDNKDYKRIVNTLKIALNADSLKKEDQNKLSRSLSILNKNNPSYTGLFSKGPRKGQSVMSQGYELIGTASIISKGESGIRTSVGKKLVINKTDYVDFGVKHDSRYATQSGNKGTIESDLLIQKGSDDIIGVDFKYTSGNKNISLTGKRMARQLKGVTNSLKDGQITDYVFVTNSKFTEGTKNLITEKNIELTSIFMKRKFNDEYKNEVKQFLSKNNTSIKKISHNSKVLDGLYQINKKYYIPQIGVSEEVNLK